MTAIRSIGITLSCLVAALFAALLIGTGVASAAPPAPCDPRAGCNPSPCDPRTGCVDLGPVNPPTNVAAQAPEDGSVVLTWTRPEPKITTSGAAIPIATLLVMRDGQQVAQIQTTPNKDDPDLVDPASWTDQHPPQGRDVSYAVVSVDNTGRASPNSNSTSIRPVQQTAASGTTPSSTGSTSPQGADSVDIRLPDFKGSNAKTAYEEYGGVNVGHIHDTYGFVHDDWIKFQMWPLSLMWSMLTFFSFLSMALLSWTVTKDVYAGIISAVTVVVQAVFQLPIYDSLLHLVMTLAGISIVVLVLRQYGARVRRAMIYIVVGLTVSAIYTMFAPTIVQSVMTLPVSIGQGVLGVTSDLSSQFSDHPELAEQRFNISIKPTYNGNQYEQGVRRYQDVEFLNTVYASECELNFGDLPWATSHYVPNRENPAKDGYGNLTYCEYYVRAEAYGNSTEMDYLTDQVESNAPGSVWEFFQGKNPGGHYARAVFIVPALLFRTMLHFLLAYVFAVCIFTLGYLLVKMTLLILAGMLPMWNDALARAAKRMVIKFALPPAMAVSLVLGLVISTIGYNTVGLLGWAGMMIFQVVAGIASLVAGLMIFRAGKRRDNEIKEEGRQERAGYMDRVRGQSGRDQAGDNAGDSSGYAPAPTQRHGGVARVIGAAGTVVATVSTGGVGAVASTAGRAVVRRGEKRWEERQGAHGATHDRRPNVHAERHHGSPPRHRALPPGTSQRDPDQKSA